MSKTETLKTASVLAFERKLDPSDALFSAGRWENRPQGADWPAIGIREKSVRGTISNRLNDKEQANAAKLDASIENPNLQTVDIAALPKDADTLRVRFTLRILAGAGTPSACNNAAYQQKLQQTVDAYATQTGFGQLATRYACNLANGRFLWRNRIGAEAVEIHIGQLAQGQIARSWTFDAQQFSLRHFDIPASAATPLIELAALIEDGLAARARYVLLEVLAYVRIGDGQEVYPSQELILEKGDKKGQKSKTLYKVGEVAAMHSQKIGNALRTIDTWYPEVRSVDRPDRAVEPYGSVTSQGKAYRQPNKKADFYHLLDEWVLKDKAPAVDDRHYVMATLIRGGVFGEKE